jgi:hypothetical protein
MRRVAKTDDNHMRVINALRDVGASVFSTHQLGGGFPDCVVGFRCDNYLLEIKDGKKPPSKRKLTDDEVAFMESWKGQYAVVNSAEEALDLVQAVDYTAWCHTCSEEFVYYNFKMGKPDYKCPKCKTIKHVTVP